MDNDERERSESIRYVCCLPTYLPSIDSPRLPSVCVCVFMCVCVCVPVCSGSEIFDLYGGSHPSTNIDLLSFFGFASLNLPTDSVGFILAVCTDFNTTHDNGRLRRRMDIILDRMEQVFVTSPLAVDELWDHEEHERYEMANEIPHSKGVGESKVTYECESSRLFRMVLTNDGVGVTMPILARLTVIDDQQLHDPTILQRILSGIPTLTNTQERLSILIVLHWLKSFEQGLRKEFREELQCQRLLPTPDVSHEHTFPTIPFYTSSEYAMIRLKVDPMYRQRKRGAKIFMKQQLDRIFETKEDGQYGGGTFLSHREFYKGLCITKLNHLRMIQHAARTLITFL